MPTTPALPLLIEQQADLDRLCDALHAERVVYLDTEFVRTNTYAPHLGLIQVSGAGHVVCIDPLAGMNLDRFWAQTFDPERTHVLHSCKQDMEVLWFTCGRVLPRVIDTQVCAALLGFPAQIGYAGLVKELVGAEIAKTQTRTDWSRRPLTDAQLEYAAEDVEHLPEMHTLLRQRLEAAGRYEWAIEDSRELCDTRLYEPDATNAWQRLKSIPFLPPAQQARACALAEWREQRAVQVDKPRGWILSDKALLQMAERNPTSRNDLRRIEDLPDAVIRKQGDRLLALLASANEALSTGAVQYEQQYPDRDADKAAMKKLGGVVRRHAEALGIAAEVIASRRDLQTLLRGAPAPRLVTGWRRALLGDELDAALADSGKG